MNGDCDIWTAAITHLVDGELGTEERAALESHMKSCESCRSKLAVRHGERKQWRDALSLSSDASDRVMIVENARSYLKGAPWWRRWPATRSWDELVAGISLVAIAILLTVLFQWRTSQGPEWAPSTPAVYYMIERTDADQTEMPRPY